MAQFYGPFEIDTLTEQADGTALTFKSYTGSNGEYIPAPMFVPSVLTDLIKEEATDYNDWYSNRLNPVIDEIILLFQKYNVFIGAGEGVASDMSYVFDRVIDFVRQGRRQVEEKQWGSPEYAKTMKQLIDHMKG